MAETEHTLETFHMLDRLLAIVPKVAGGYSHLTGGIDADYMVKVLGAEVIRANSEIADLKARLTHGGSDYHKRGH